MNTVAPISGPIGNYNCSSLGEAINNPKYKQKKHNSRVKEGIEPPNKKLTKKRKKEAINMNVSKVFLRHQKFLAQGKIPKSA